MTRRLISSTSKILGRGEGGEGLGKGNANHHRKDLSRVIHGTTQPVISGVKRISGLIYEKTRVVLKVLLENLIREKQLLLWT